MDLNLKSILLDNATIVDSYVECKSNQEGIDNIDNTATDVVNEISFINDTAPMNTIEKEEDKIYLNSYYKYANDFENPDIKPEIILSENQSRFSMYPIDPKYKQFWENYKLQLANTWVVEEVDLSRDYHDWQHKLSSNDRYFLTHILAFFSAADGIVNTNIIKNLLIYIKIKEIEAGYCKQIEIENIHNEMYSLLIDTYIKDQQLYHKIINSITTIPAIKKKADWCKKWMDSDKTFAHKLIAFAIVEGIFFSGAFASIFWLKLRPILILVGLQSSNELISKDEYLHYSFACMIYRILINKLKPSIIYEMVNEAVLIEDEFINVAIPCSLLGMNSKHMSQYIRYVADRFFVDIGLEKIYNVKNPFEFMNKIDMYVKSNFFERRVTAYSNSKINNPRVFNRLDKF